MVELKASGTQDDDALATLEAARCYERGDPAGNTRTLVRLPFEIQLRISAPSPVYQKIAAQAAGMRAGGAGFRAIAEHFGVDDHTAAKAVRWFYGEL